MGKSLQLKYQSDRKVWDNCAITYEDQIVSGHPDVVAYEKFEENFLDKVCLYLDKNYESSLKIIDVGCGSGRLHVRYGKYVKIPSIENVTGVDFSEKMLEIARLKLKQEGIEGLSCPVLEFEQGSAFNLQPETATVLPVAVNLINSLGVMQGEKGAQELFKAMRRCVEHAGGIAIISCYQKAFVKQYALPQYESTLNVCGQPAWLKPDTFASKKYILKPKYFKRANEDELSLEVEVYENNRLIIPSFLLYRDNKLTEQVIKSGKIKTYSDYESNWYSFSQIEDWMKRHWNGLPMYHIPTQAIDPENAEAGQLAILDINNILKEFISKIS
ncbi:MAG: class I SAM-dependent methyltransferase [Bacteroidales bacterium]|nr:class I SAM-dependent methyltransferase [Bacteroidales bacterium]